MPRKTSLVATDFSWALLCNRYNACYTKRSMLMHVFQKRSHLLVCGCPEVFPIFKAERLPKTQFLEEKWCTTWPLTPTEIIRNVFMASSTLNWLPLCSEDLGAKREELVTDDFGRACHLLNHLHHLLLRVSLSGKWRHFTSMRWPPNLDWVDL